MISITWKNIIITKGLKENLTLQILVKLILLDAFIYQPLKSDETFYEKGYPPTLVPDYLNNISRVSLEYWIIKILI